MLFHTVLATRQCECGPETQEINYMGFDEIPWEEIAFSSIKQSLKLFVEQYPNNLDGCTVR